MLIDHKAPVTCGCISHDNRHVVSGSCDNRVLVWDSDTGEVQHELLGHTDRITCVTTTKDDSLVFSGTYAK